MAVDTTFREREWLIDLPHEIKQMILRLVNPFALPTLLQAIPTLRPLAICMKLPIMDDSLASAQRVPEPAKRHFAKQFHHVVNCHDGRYLSFQANNNNKCHTSYWEFTRCPGPQLWHSDRWKKEPDSIGAGDTMSVSLWPRKRGQRVFLNVPELIAPSIFDYGRLCLGYEKVEVGPWKLVVRQISDWNLVAEQSVVDPDDRADILGPGSDLVVQYSRNSASIHIWNPRCRKLWEVQHPRAIRFNAPHILDGEKGFITTSIMENYNDDFHVLSWRSVSWHEGEQPSYMEQRDFHLSYTDLHLSDMPTHKTARSWNSCSQIQRIGRNGISFCEPSFDAPLTVTYTGERLSTSDLEIGIFDAFSDGTEVIRTNGRCKNSEIHMTKDGKPIWRLQNDRDCRGAIVFLDTYLVCVHSDHRRYLPCQVSFLKMNGELVANFHLTMKYKEQEIRVLSEEGSVVVFAGDLSEATVWSFFNTPLSAKTTAKRDYRYSEDFELRPRKKRKVSYNV
ncbi:hypothetical protein N7528_009205 [Penicillium herquei]|nr:hypothetical protein N7528_009205 [Penicillium herquei]